ncbi:AmmeMemoRadiSam system protein B [bacterium]|nr:AmmeMemoRadiSam system protein B [bacterium]
MIREPFVEGKFYPGVKDELVTLIKNCEGSFLEKKSNKILANGKLVGFISPHAGFIYSGPVATWGMARLSLEKPLPSKFLLLGPKHTRFGAAAALSGADSWKTLLGNVSVERELREALLSTDLFELDDEAHAYEHSLEVQLPFLQHLYDSCPLAVVPLALQYASFETCSAWGKAIGRVLSEKRFSDVCVLVSSDFSHDCSRSEAYKLDGEAMDVIEKLNGEAFYKLVVSEERSICGVIPITVFLESLKGKRVKGTRLTYSTSMDVVSHSRGVGYASIMFEEV